MKELTLQELQKEGLKILKDVHSWCLANGVMYSVGYGTLLGAIRHKGFIPWDDDVDIIMPRKHYDRFCKEYKSARYKIKSITNDKDCYLAFARVYDDQMTITDSVIPWCSKEGGVWIDIFPIDYVIDSKEIFFKHKNSMHRKWKNVVIARAATVNFKRNRSFMFNIRLLAKKMLTMNGCLTHWLLQRFMKGASNITVESSTHWSQLTCMDGYEWHKTEDFVTTLPVPFEDTEVMVMNGYDTVLHECFGDYMQLPPEEQRVGHSDGLTNFYWK